MEDMNAPDSHHDDSGAMTWATWLSKGGFLELFGTMEEDKSRFDSIPWQPTQADRSAAWNLYTELRTRITTQPLPYRSGDEATALDSVFRLFELTREIVKAHEGCHHFATLAIQVLNVQVRPFTAKWHRLKVDGRLSSADVRYLFRQELAELQKQLRLFTHLLGLLAGYGTLVVKQEESGSMQSSKAPDGLWKPVPFGIADDPLTKQWATEINAKERAEILERRRFYNVEGREQPSDALGLALSGGGIRSATFALGVVQVLARKGILRSVDFLSTVSGGGYLGAFISSFLSDEAGEAHLNPTVDALPFGAESERESTPVRHLRNHSKYLSEGGFKTFATIAAQVGYGIVVSALLLSLPLLLGVLVTSLCFADSFKTPPAEPFTFSVFNKIALILLGVGVLLLPVIQTFVRNQPLRKWWGRGCVIWAVICALFLLCEAMPPLFHLIKSVGTSVVLAGAMALPLVLGAAGLWLGATSRLGRIAFWLFHLTGPIFILAAFFWLCERFIANATTNSDCILTILVLTSGLYTSFCLNINFASPHRYYRDRLARTYLTRPASENSIRVSDPQLLSKMNENKKAPYHLINAALNIPGCDDPNLRGRNADFFLFSKHFCGSPITGLHPTTAWEALDRHLDLGTAMAISGAAAAPHMGTFTARRYTFLLAMLNVRLGYWLRRPSGSGKGARGGVLPPIGWYYFFLELTTCFISEKTNFLNISDGGHIENLGIYELLRRRCKFIIAVDGEADLDRSFGGLVTLAQLAKIDLGVTIELNLADLRMDRDGHSRAHFGLSRIDYPEGHFGLLLYIKTSLTGNESEFLKKYRADHPDFPHQSTAQQLFSETQFEAYRALGEHVAEDLFRRDLVDEWDIGLPAREWFERLAARLL